MTYPLAALFFKQLTQEAQIRDKGVHFKAVHDAIRQMEGEHVRIIHLNEEVLLL